MKLQQSDLLAISLQRQCLTAKASRVEVVARLCGLQAQFANNPGYALRVRATDFSPAGWNEGMVKIWSFRGTLHAVGREDLGLFLSARGVPKCWDEVGYSGWSGIEAKRLQHWVEFILARMDGGVCEREALKEACRKAGMPPEELAKVFHGWGGLIYEMNRRGLLAYDCVTAKRFVRCGNVKWMERDEARAEILRRYFASFGPATLADCAYFTGYKRREVEELIKRFELELQSAECAGELYYYTGKLQADDVPPCVFLAGFDQLLMGYKNRTRVMEERFKPDVTTCSGIVHPTVLLHGRIAGKWKRDGKRVLITPFRSWPKKDKKLVERYALQLFRGETDEVFFAEG